MNGQTQLATWIYFQLLLKQTKGVTVTFSVPKKAYVPIKQIKGVTFMKRDIFNKEFTSILVTFIQKYIYLIRVLIALDEFDVQIKLNKLIWVGLINRPLLF